MIDYDKMLDPPSDNEYCPDCGSVIAWGCCDYCRGDNEYDNWVDDQVTNNE